MFNSLAEKLDYGKGLFNGYVHVYINILGEIQPLETIEYDDYNNIIEKYKGYYDIYATENTMSNSYTRTKADLLQLRALYIDLDNITEVETVINKINLLVDSKVIPIPSKVIFSGRGLHIKWSLKDYAAKSKDDKNLKVWSRLQKYLAEKLKGALGELAEVDTKAMDPVRILRVEGTINSKSDKKVKCLVSNKAPSYDLYDLYNTYTPYKPTEPTEKQNKSKGNKTLLTTKRTLNYARLKDLETILELRAYDLTDIRNRFLMFYTTYYILVNKSDFEETLQEVKELASRIKSKKYTSLSELKCLVNNGLKRAEAANKGEKVLPKSETIIRDLEITEEEQEQLITLKSLEIKYKNKNKKRNEDRRNDEGLTQREQQKQEVENKIKELINEGYNMNMVSKELGLNRSTISRSYKHLFK